MLINARVIRGFCHELKKNGLSEAVKTYAIKLGNVLAFQAISEVDKNEHKPYFKNRHRLIRIMLWNVSNVILRRRKISLDKNNVNILFVALGGLGDLIINQNYMTHLQSYLSEDNVRIYLTSDRD